MTAEDTVTEDAVTERRPRRTDAVDRLAELEEERRFLLRSLADLEREHQAGDVDDTDYQELRDGYTVRAAATLREIEAGRSALPVKPPANWRRRVVMLVTFVGLVAIVWWVLSATSAQRLPGQGMTGSDPREEREQLLSTARLAELQGEPAVALQVYETLLERDPEDVEALTYHAWLLLRSGTTSTEIVGFAMSELEQATTLDPSYPDPRCFLGIVGRGAGLPEAEDDIATCLSFNPPANVRALIESSATGSIPASVPPASEPPQSAPVDSVPVTAAP